jgi:hypothetical protein
MSRFATITEDPEYDDDVTWQEQEDYDEDLTAEFMGYDFDPMAD